MDTRRQSLHVTTHVAEAEMLVEMLVEAGIDADLTGPSSAALIGVAPHLMPVSVNVAVEDVAAAQELLDAFWNSSEGSSRPEGPAPVSSPEDEDGQAQHGLRPRRPVVGAGLAFVFPGGSHFYARWNLTGLFIALCWLMGLVLLATRVAETVGAVLLVASIVIDMMGGVNALRGFNPHRTAETWPQLRRILVILVVQAALVSGSLVLQRLPDWLFNREMQAFRFECGADSITIKNQGDVARRVDVVNVQAIEATPFLLEAPPTEGLMWLGMSPVELAPAASMTIGWKPPTTLRCLARHQVAALVMGLESMGAGVHSLSCSTDVRLRFSHVSKPGDVTEAVASCPSATVKRVRGVSWETP